MNESANYVESVPACVGIIMDGNRRWAKNKGLPKLEGHRAGLETMKSAVRFVRECNIKHLVVYAFSTENWNREPAEIAYLMNLFHTVFHNDAKEFSKEGVRIRVIGQRERFSADLQDAMNKAEKETEQNDLMTLWICLSYGGRAEIVSAAQRLIATGENITEQSLRANMWSAEMPDPDIVIRTSGEKRLSGFLLWQSAYSELFFTDTLWPDFSKEEFNAILAEFATRERRNGR